MVKLAKEFSSEVNRLDCLSYDEFLIWTEASSKELESISAFYKMHSHDRPKIIFSSDDTKLIERVFLCFQAFYISFLCLDVETIRFQRIYDNFREVISECLSSVTSDSYGDIFIICNEQHEAKLIRTMKDLRHELDRNQKLMIIRPGERHIDWSVDEFSPQDMSNFHQVPIVYHKVNFKKKSKSGIGMGDNYVYSPSRSLSDSALEIDDLKAM